MMNISRKKQTGYIDEIDKIVALSLLYDFYGELLSEHKKRIFEDYVLNDLSLSEIAMEQGISRQGVHDVIKRCTKELTDYEDKLGLIHKFDKTREKVNQMKHLSFQLKKSGDLSIIDEIEELSNKILEDL